MAQGALGFFRDLGVFRVYGKRVFGTSGKS